MGLVFNGHEAEGLEHASLPFAHWMQHLRHALDTAGLGLKRNFHEIAFRETSRQLQQSAIDGDDVNVAIGLLTVAELDYHWRGCEFDAISTMSGIGLGKVCHAKATMALAGKSGEITEAHCPDSLAFRALAGDFYPFSHAFRTNSLQGFGKCSDEIGRNQRMLTNMIACDVAREAVQIYSG